MDVRIFDVEHGFCSYVIADNGNVMLFDCGHNSTTGFRPSNYLITDGCTGVENLVISNYDEDHLDDLPNLRSFSARLPVSVLYRNRNISPEQLRQIKRQSGAIGPGMSALLEMLETYVHGVSNPPAFPDIEFAGFGNSYPTFSDTNNLSLVSFLFYRDIRLVFPGDLEQAGWLALLAHDSFRRYLSRVNIFVASHHGRESGYCKEVFDYCYPDIVVISDGAIQYESQETTNLYRSHAQGIRWDDGRPRYVLTTRSNGVIRINETPQQLGYRITTDR